MTTISGDVWRQIEPARPSGDELVGRQAAPELTSRLLAAVDSRGRRNFLVALEPQDADCRDVSSRGLTVTTDALVLPGHAASRYIKLSCEDLLGYAMFDLLAAEIADRLHADTETPSEIVSRVIAKWRRFWGQLPRLMLTREQQIGLFTELWFLMFWLLPATGSTKAVRMWRGPHGARHDFETDGLSVEAKGTTSTRGRIHQINGVQQLDPPENGKLLFFSMRIREEAGATNSLPLLIASCKQQLSEDPDAEGLFETAIIAAGYSANHEEDYSKTHWRVVEQILFDTSREFPRLNKASFGDGMPMGVENVDYTINLGTFDSAIVASTPAQATSLLASVRE